MTEIEQQRLFCRLIGQLIDWAYTQPGYALRFGEALRTKEQAQHNAESGAGIANSLHLERLAIDLMLDIDGVWQTSTERYRPLGEHWTSLHPLNRWGGDFRPKPDGDHFSMERHGVK